MCDKLQMIAISTSVFIHGEDMAAVHQKLANGKSVVRKLMTLLLRKDLVSPSSSSTLNQGIIDDILSMY